MIIEFLTGINIELFIIISGMITIIMMLAMFYYGKLDGLYAYIFVALIVCNIQVLKGINCFFTTEAIPLGTFTYGTISIALSIITEFYGKKLALRAINLGFAVMIIFTIFIVMTIGYKPLNPNGLADEMRFLYDNHFHMIGLFSPIPAILISGLLAYFLSENALVYIQIFAKKITGDRWLTVRTYLANIVAAFVDLVIMNYLAWVVFAANPMSIKQVFISYVLMAYPFRLLTALAAIPTIKVAKLIFDNINLTKKIIIKN